MVDLDGVLDVSLAAHGEQRIDDVDVEVAAVAGHRAHRLQCRADIEEVVDRLTEQEEIPPAPLRVVVLGEAGHGFQTRVLGDRQLVGGGI
jgi:hypothetical protein